MVTNHRYIIRTSIILFIIVNPVLIRSQYSKFNTYKFDHITSEHDLSQSTINCIYQDKIGFIWIGTDNGLNRYDGYSFRVYKNNSNDTTSLSCNRITCIAEDFLGRLWIGTWDNGINIFDRDKNIFQQLYTGNSLLSHNSIKNIYIDSNNRVWIGTIGGGLNLYSRDLNNIICFNKENSGISSNNVYSIIEGSHGCLWIGTESGCIDKLEVNSLNIRNSKFSHIDYSRLKKSTETGKIFSRTLYKYGHEIWIGTDKEGLYIIDTNSGKVKSLPEKLNMNKYIVTSICKDNKENIWIGTDGNGIFIINPVSQEIVNHLRYDIINKYSISSNAVYSIFKDISGTMWVGTYSGGVNKYNGYKYKFNCYTQIANSYGLSAKSVMAIYQDSKKNIWIGTDRGGLNRFNSKKDTIERIKNGPDITNLVVKSICEDSQGTLWIGTYHNGLCWYNSMKNQIEHWNKGGIDSSDVWAICKDHKNCLWIGLMGGGLYKFDKEKKIFNSYQNNFKRGNEIKTILIYDDKNFWVGTQGGGLFLFDRNLGNFIPFNLQRGDTIEQSYDNINAIFKDSREILWFGTTDGLYKYDKNIDSIIKFTTKNGLPDDVINGILEEDTIYLWISTNKGLSRFDISNETFRNYDTEDGLQGNEFNYTSQLKTKKGEIYFGGINGFNRFFPNSIKENDKVPKVALTELRIFDKEIKPYDTLNGKVILDSLLNNKKEIILRRKENVFTLEFSALDYIAPLKNEFKYLLGFEGLVNNEDTSFINKWINTNALNRTVTYKNLKPGRYIFHVMASNSEGIWNKTYEKILVIQIIPAWWQTQVFKIGIIIFLLIVILFVYTYYINAVNRKKLQIEVKKRTKELKYLNKTGQELTSDIFKQEKEIFKLIFTQANELIPIENMYIAMHDATTGIVNFYLIDKKIKETINIDEKKWAHRKINMKQRGKTEEIILTGEPILIKTYKEQIKWYNKPGHKNKPASEARSWLGVPMKIGERVLGVIGIYDLVEEFKYDEQYMQFMMTLASQAAIALENARLYKESNSRINLLETINQVSKNIEVKLVIDDILHTIITQIVNQLKCNHCTVFFPKEKENGDIYLVAHISVGRKELLLKKDFKANEGLVGLAYSEGETILCDNVFDHSHFILTREKTQLSRSMLLVPVKTSNRPYAIICADQDKYGWFTENDKNFVEVLARQAGNAIEYAGGLESLLNITDQILNLKNIKDLFSLILKGAIKLSNTITGAIFLFDNDRNTIIDSYYQPPDIQLPLPRLNKMDSVTRIIIDKSEVIIIPDIERNLNTNPEIHGRFQSLVGIPLKIEDKVVGVLYLLDKIKHEFTETEISFLKTLAGQATIAMENERLYREIMEAKESAEKAKKSAEITLKEKEAFFQAAEHEMLAPLDSIMKTFSLFKRKIKALDIKDKRLNRLPFEGILYCKFLSYTFENLDFLRFENIKLSLTYAKIFKDVIIPIIEVTREYAKAYNIELRYSGFQYVHEYMQIDVQKMHNVFFNLLRNAIRYSYQGTTIYIKGIATVNNKSIIHIENTGIGIPENFKNRIFGLYERADNAKKHSANGTGIGLYIAKNIIEAHNSKIYVLKNDNPTIFAIELFKQGGK